MCCGHYLITAFGDVRDAEAVIDRFFNLSVADSTLTARYPEIIDLTGDRVKWICKDNGGILFNTLDDALESLDILVWETTDYTLLNDDIIEEEYSGEDTSWYSGEGYYSDDGLVFKFGEKSFKYRGITYRIEQAELALNKDKDGWYISNLKEV